MSSKLTVKCDVVNGVCNPRFFVTVSNGDKTVYQGSTSKKGEVKFCINCPGQYKITIKSPDGIKPGSITKWINICNDDCKTVFAEFYLVRCEKTEKTFVVTDQNYKGLPITQGEIALCHTT